VVLRLVREAADNLQSFHRNARGGREAGTELAESIGQTSLGQEVRASGVGAEGCGFDEDTICRNAIVTPQSLLE